MTPTVAEVEALRSQVLSADTHRGPVAHYHIDTVVALCDFWLAAQRAPAQDAPNIYGTPHPDADAIRSSLATPPSGDDNAVRSGPSGAGGSASILRIEALSAEAAEIRRDLSNTRANREENLRNLRLAEARAEALGRALRKAQTIVDAAITWAYCPAAGAYEYSDDDQGDYSVEGCCEALGEAVQQYTGLDEHTPSDKRWTYAEMREIVDAALASAPAGGEGK